MKKENIRYYISKYSLYIFIFCLLFLLQRALLATIFDIKKYTIFDRIYVYEIVLALISFLEVYKCVKISKRKLG